MEELEIKKTDIKKLNLSKFSSNVQNFITVLKPYFKTIMLSSNNKEGDCIYAYFEMGDPVIFELGEEYVYLKGTPFYTKDSPDKLVDLVRQLYFLD